MKKLILFLLITCFVVSGCAQTGQNSGNEQLLGTGAGAAIGALIGQVIGGNTGATLLGAAAGGLLGYVVATHVSTQTNQVYNQQETQKLIADNSANKTVVQVHDESIEPTNRFKAGDNVTVRVRYIVMDSKHTKIPVQERKTLWYDGTQQAVFEDTTIQRENGTWESLITFQLPENAKKGQYQVRQDIYSGQTTDTSLVQFTVI